MSETDRDGRRQGRNIAVVFATTEEKEEFRRTLALLRIVEEKTGPEILLEMVKERCLELGISELPGQLFELQEKARKRVERRRGR